MDVQAGADQSGPAETGPVSDGWDGTDGSDGSDGSDAQAASAAAAADPAQGPDAARRQDPAADAEPGPQLAAARAGTPETGQPQVDAALRLLDELPGLPVSEHAALFERVHSELSGVLGDLDPESAGAGG